MKCFEKWKDEFAEPNKRYGVYDIGLGGVADPNYIDYTARNGFAGVVGCVGYTRDFPNDAADFERCAAGMRRAITQGMHTWIYDEKGYPSGSAGGYVTETNPQYVAKGLYCYDYWRVVSGPSTYRADVPGDKLWKALLVPIASGSKKTEDASLADNADPIDVTSCLNKNGTLYVNVPQGSYYLFMMSIRRLFDGTHATESYSEPRNYISLSDKKAAKAFIRCTHEKYKEVLGDEFGKGVLATFTDEPSLISWNIRRAVFPILPWLDSYPQDFEKRFGYPFEFACAAVVLRGGRDFVKRRCDFWEFIADTVADGYFGTIRNWAHKNHLKSSGHLLEEERLQAHVYCYGSFYRAMRMLDWPGIDQLNSTPESLMNDTCVPIARFVASFGDINGEREVFTEFSDHESREKGVVAPKIDYYMSVNWHLAMGVNDFTSFFSWNGFTEDDKKEFNRYTARCGTLLRKGVRDSRVAVLYPDAALWATYTPSTEMRAVDASPRTLALEKSFVRASWDLLHNHVDFDYIDSRILEECNFEGGKLTYRDRAYEAIVLPDCYVLQDASAAVITGLAEQDFPVICVGDLPLTSRDSSKRSAYADNLEALAAAGKITRFDTDDETLWAGTQASDACKPVFFTDVTSGDAALVLTHTRRQKDGTLVLFVTNMGREPFCAQASFGPCRCVGTANAYDGSITAEGKPAKTKEIRLSYAESAFFFLK